MTFREARRHFTECVTIASVSPDGHNDDVPPNRKIAMRAFVAKQHPALLKVYFLACYIILIEEVVRALT